MNSVVHAAWRAPDGRIGFFFVNLRATQAETVHVTIEPQRYGAPTGTACTLTRVDTGTGDVIASGAGPVSLELPLDARRVTALVLEW